MSIRFSHSSFPCTSDQRSACALPWGMLLQPLAPLPHASSSTHRTQASRIPRCSACLAYINPYATFARASQWRCALCRTQNTFTDRRYESMDERHRMPELVLTDIEYVWSEEDAAGGAKVHENGTDLDAEEDAAERAAVEAYLASRDPTAAAYDPSATLQQPFAPAASASASPPAYVFLVDLSAPHGTLELVKSALLAALEALPSSVWVGLCVVSGRIGLYDLKCSLPTVSYASIRPSSATQARGAPSLDDAPTSLPLHLLLPLDSFLQKLSHCKENLAAAIESLISHQPQSDLAELERQASAGVPGSAGGGGLSGGAQEDPEAGGWNASPSPPPTVAAAATSSAAISGAARAPRTNPLGFGAACAALLDLFSSSVVDEGLELNVRILSFLCQRPNYGLGALRDRGADEDGNALERSAEEGDRWEFQANSGPMAASGGGASSDGGGGCNRPMPRSASAHASSASSFYHSLASLAAQRGIAMDLYAIAPSPAPAHSLDLATLKILSETTGGNLLFYPSAREGTSLPQDLFRSLRTTQGFRGLLRVRTSPEMFLSSVYGHLAPSDKFAELYHLGGCDGRKSYGFEFDFRSSAEGFRGGYAGDRELPVIQVAFSYIGVHALPATEGGGERVEHRLRVLTRQVPLVFWPSPQKGLVSKQVREETKMKAARQSVSELFAATAPEVVLTLLVQQLIHVSLERGIGEARLLLRDWLVGFIVAYHAVFPPTLSSSTSGAAAGTGPQPSSPPPEQAEPLTVDSLDMKLSQAPGLQFIPRFVMALLKSPLLSTRTASATTTAATGASSASAAADGICTADARVSLQVLYAGLEADYLVKSIYPTLSSFSLGFDPRLSGPQLDPSILSMPPAARQALVAWNLHHPVLYLTRFSLSGCGDEVFLLDSYLSLRVLYLQSLVQKPAAAKAGAVPLPPPSSSALAREIKRAKAAAPYITPRVVYCVEESGSANSSAAAGSEEQSAGAGKDAAALFFASMLEDEAGGHGGFSYQTFIAEVARETVKRMTEQ